ncbi:hypothetical protein Poly30_13390 [Planctomycetes bacterium Poly30]|uniref:Uncharacterized protein n=2 Tax=Saltatorellus ferox TaxID=2528018 RepID=A0A518EP33_9BACT|nr:hypothetical protein Poly30_13390 [Planctomycetes bacterium Poly30]
MTLPMLRLAVLLLAGSIVTGQALSMEACLLTDCGIGLVLDDPTFVSAAGKDSRRASQR